MQPASDVFKSVSTGSHRIKAVLLTEEIKKGVHFDTKPTPNGMAHIQLKDPASPIGSISISGSVLGIHNKFEGGDIDLSSAEFPVSISWIAGVDEIYVNEVSPVSGISGLTIVVERW
jgi:hypothetical protein